MIVIDTIRTPVYAATSTVQFVGKGLNASVMGGNLIRITSAPIRRSAGHLLGEPLPSCTVAQVGTTSIAKITGKATSAVLAKRAADAIPAGFIAYSQAHYIQNQLNYVSEVNQAITGTQTAINILLLQIHEVGARTIRGRLLYHQLIDATNALLKLNKQLAAAQLNYLSPTAPIRILNGASVPHAPISPKPLNDALLAFVAGLALGIVLAVIRDTMDDKLRTRAEFESL